MSGKRRTVLQRMDALVWWSGASDMVKHEMSGHADERRRRPMRWLPLLPMVCAAGLLATAIAAPAPTVLYGVAAPVMMIGSALAINGPLGKPSVDDERKAALRENAFFLCLAFLALANIVGGPALLLAAAVKGWAFERCAGVAFALFMANMTWFVSFPTLYASWNLPKLSEDES